MELLVKDRLYLLSLLPAENNFEEYNLKKKIIDKVSFTDEERSSLDLKEDPETKRIMWDVKKDTPLVVDLSQDQMKYIEEACKKKSDEVLPDDMWETVEKIFNAIQSQK